MDNNNKRIIKNSSFLYIQMAIKMIVVLFTTRIVLQALGVEDFGIYNVVAGFVMMFNFISDTMVSASMRYFAYYLGLNKETELNEYFNATVVCYLIIIIVLLLAVEIVGLWFIYNKMVYPEYRLEAVCWTFHLSVIMLVINMLTVPYTSMVIAFEKMVTFAVVGLLDAIIRLAIVYCLFLSSSDRLVLYAFLLLFMSLANLLYFYCYCKTKFGKATQIHLYWKWRQIKELLSFSGWSLFWTLANVLRSQGINILLNVFFNPIVNAARGLAYNINNAVNQFVNSFFQAVRPQIMKLTAKEEFEKMISLLFSSSRYCFYLMIFIAIPIIVCAPTIVRIWLAEVPEYTILFTRLVVVTAVIDSLGLPLSTVVNATGNIKKYQLLSGIILLMNIPISYLLLLKGCQPYSVFVLSIFVSIIAQLYRIIYMDRVIGIKCTAYCKEVLLRCLFVLVPTLIISCITNNVVEGYFIKVCVVFLSTCVSLVLFVYLWGIPRTERVVLNNYIKIIRERIWIMK